MEGENQENIINNEQQLAEKEHEGERFNKLLNVNSIGSVESNVSCVSDNLDSDCNVDKLNSLLEVLEKRSNAIRIEMENVFSKHSNKQFSNTLSCYRTMNSVVNNLQNDLNKLLIESQSNSSLQGIEAINSSEDDVRKTKINNLNILIKSLKIISEIQSKIEKYNELMDSCNCLEAAQCIIDFERLIEELTHIDQSSSMDTSKIIKALRIEARFKRNNIQSRLEELFSSAICSEKTNNCVELIVKLKIDVSSSCNVVNATSMKTKTASISFQDILHSFKILNTLEQKLTRQFSHQLLTKVFIPLIQSKKQKVEISISKEQAVLKCYLDDDIEVSNASTSYHTSEYSNYLNNSEAENQEMKKFLILDIYQNVIEIIKFISINVLLSDKKLMAHLNASLWGTATSNAIACNLLKVLKSTIPEDAATLLKYQTVVDKTLEFEMYLSEVGLIGESNKVLVTYVGDIETHFAEKNRMKLLASAREILKNEYHSSVEVSDSTEKCHLKRAGSVNSNEFFILPTMKITCCTQQLVELVHNTMVQATNSSSKSLSSVLYHTAKDMLELFTALVPNIHADVLDNVPRIAMLYHNDCLYIAHHCMILAHLYQVHFHEELKASIITIDLVPQFRNTSASHFTKQISSQVKQLDDLLLDTNNFNDIQHPGSDTERAVRSVVHHCNQLSHAWMDVLPLSTYRIAVGSLLDSMMQKMIKMTEESTALGRDSAHTLRQLLLSFDADAKRIVDSSVYASHEKEKSDVYQEYIPSCKGYEQLCKILEAHVSLPILIDMYNNGDLSSLSSSALSGIARALFGDSPELDSFLMQIS